MTRAEWILGIVLMLVLVALGLFALVFWLGPNAGPAQPVAIGAPTGVGPALPAGIEPTPPFAGLTALRAYATAQRAATSWQPDAVLLSVTATWPQGSGRDALLSGETNWNMIFYAAGSQMALTVSVVDGRASPGAERPVAQTLEPLAINGWRLDSDEMIARFLQDGGDGLLGPGRLPSLTMALSTNTPERRIVWLVSLIDEVSKEAFIRRYDAGSGEVLLVTP